MLNSNPMKTCRTANYEVDSLADRQKMDHQLRQNENGACGS